MISKRYKWLWALVALLMIAAIAVMVWLNRGQKRYAEWPQTDLKAGEPFSTGYQGVDISQYQGRIFWDTLKKQNPELQFVYLRAVGKYNKDVNYVHNLNQARQLGIKVGSYHFFNMAVPVARQMADFSRMVISELQDLRPVLDVEDQSLCDGDTTHLVDSVKKMAVLMEEHYHCKPVIYTNQNFYNDYLAPHFNDYPLWIANYSNKPIVNGANPILWQKSETGHVRGIWTDVDLDQFINGGTLRDLQRK